MELHYVVLDAGAIIKGHGFEFYNKAKTIVTVPEALLEIRDLKSRELLTKLPYEIIEKSPSNECVKKVADFAQATGDFTVLSKTDIKLIALTLMLEKEVNGSFPTPKSFELQKLRKKLSSSVDKSAPSSSSSSNINKEWNIALKNKPRLTSSKQKLSAVPESETDKCIEDGDRDGEEADEYEGSCDDDEDDEEVNEQKVDDEEQEVNNQFEDINQDELIKESTNNEAIQSELDHELDHEMDLPLKIIENQSNVSGTKESIEIETQNEIDDDHLEPFPPLVSNPSIHAGEPVPDPVPLPPSTKLWSEIIQTSRTSPSPSPSRPLQQHPHHETAPTKMKPPTLPATASNEPETPSDPIKTKGGSINRTSNIIHRMNGLGSSQSESNQLAKEDDGIGWIDSNNLKLVKAGRTPSMFSQSSPSIPLEPSSAKKQIMQVGCITTDFAMQNVLMQLGLNVLSIDGIIIESLKQFVLRCMACYQIHYDMNRLFCKKCGVNHLSRVAVSINRHTNELKLHLKKNYRKDVRGTKYSIPAPGQQNRYEGEILLREDQLLTGIWRQKCVKIRKEIKSMFGEDVTSDVGMEINKSSLLRVGLGKKNPNAVKGRERRGKSKH